MISKIEILLTLVIGSIIIMFRTGIFWIYDEMERHETTNISIIDKWVDSGHGGYSLQPMCELEDHRIFKMSSFDYNRVVLNKSYQIEIYKHNIAIINEKWRL